MTLLGAMESYSIAAREIMSSKHNPIPQMEFEGTVMNATGLSLSQARLALAFITAVPVGAGLRLFKSPTARHLYSLVTGFLLVCYPFGAGVVQVVPPAVLTYLAMLVLPRRCGTLAWLINFPYLIWLHIVNASGQSWSEGQLDFTAGSMTLVLKLISMAVAYQDNFRKDLGAYQESHKVTRLPNPLEYLSFMFAVGNLLGGPVLEFRDYQSFIDGKEVWDSSSTKVPSPWIPGLRLFFEGQACIIAYLYLEPKWGLPMLRGEWYPQQSTVVKLASHVACGVTYQLRYFYVWKLAESSLTMAGLNFIKWSDDGKPMWGRYCNARWLGVQLTDSARNLPVNWNIVTGTFLRRYVYERLTPKGSKPGFLQLLATQMVSGVWHGLYPGYLMFFASSALMFHSSIGLYRLEQAYLPPAVHGSLPWRLLKIAYTMACLNHNATSFVLLGFRECLSIYRDVHYLIHISMLLLSILATVLPTRRPGGKGKGSSKADGKAVGSTNGTNGSSNGASAGHSHAE